MILTVLINGFDNRKKGSKLIDEIIKANELFSRYKRHKAAVKV
ncbi:hypothetical protein [Persephonella sp. IF05-L8]